MSSLREQFDVWLREYKPDAFIFERDLCWAAYQACHAASGRDELLKALEGLMDCQEAEYAIHSEKSDNDWDEYDYMMIPRWRAALRLIKKARGEQ